MFHLFSLFAGYSRTLFFDEQICFFKCHLNDFRSKSVVASRTPHTCVNKNWIRPKGAALNSRESRQTLIQILNLPESVFRSSSPHGAQPGRKARMSSRHLASGFNAYKPFLKSKWRDTGHDWRRASSAFQCADRDACAPPRATGQLGLGHRRLLTHLRALRRAAAQPSWRPPACPSSTRSACSAREKIVDRSLLCLKRLTFP